jgi:hypothetical protein
MKNSLTVLCVICLLILAGCSSEKDGDIPEHLKDSENLTDYPPDPQPEEQTKADSEPERHIELEFVREESFGETDGVYLGRMSGVAVDNSDRVFIGDTDQKTIHVFDPDGSYRTSLGREGQGPGEFNAISVSIPMRIHSNRLFVADVSGIIPHRINVYFLDSMEFSHTVNLIAENRGDFEELAGYFPDQFYPRNDGTFLVSYKRPLEINDPESYIRYFIQDSNGRIISDQVFEQNDLTYLPYTYPNGYTVAFSFPFLGKSLFTVSDDDQLYSAWTEDFLIEVHDPHGEYLRAFEHPIEKKAFNQREYIEGKVDAVRRMIREANDLPQTWPALESMFFDNENRLWVSAIVDDDEVYEWWVLQETGEVIARFEWPRDEPIEVVNNGYIYTRETDEMDVASIVRYRIEMEEI